jgi:SPP1 gp7 family putative phage head morphogenesis protein
MLQRALDPDDPAGGKWEFPGGHIEGDEKPIVAAAREWREETGAILPLEPEAMAALAFGNGSSWTSGNGIYQGFVYPVPSESCVPVRCDTVVSNPDDPDSDQVEAIAWWNPADLPGNPAARPELLADIGAVMDALGCGQDDCCGAECCSDGCCDGSGGCTCGPADVAKAADPQVPKAPAGDGQPPPVQSAWPGWDYDLQAAAYWAPLLAAAFTGALDAGALAEAWLKLAPVSDASTKPERLADLTAQAAKWLADRGTDFGPAVTDTIEGVLTDGYAIGAVSADAAAEHLGSIAADMGDWEPGASSVARELAGNLGAGDGLSDLLRQADVKIKSIAETRLNDLAKVLADGAERGLSQDEMADAIKGMLSDPSRARMIVATELARAANNAAAWAYRLHAVELLRFSTAEDAKVCPECDAAEALGARPLDDLPSPPLHPFCRCAITVA